MPAPRLLTGHLALGDAENRIRPWAPAGPAGENASASEEIRLAEAAIESDDLQIDPGFEVLRAHRAELLESMRALEQALAAPASGRSNLWAERVGVALVEFEADFGEHVQLTAGPDGLYRALLATAPQLSG